MPLTFFHQASKRVVLGRRGEASPFGHTFGGGTSYAGLTAFDGEPPVHLLFRLNTDDPAVGVRLPDARWLPLLCAVRYGACPLGYRVISDTEVEILHQVATSAWPGFPSDDYPVRLPGGPLALVDGGYDPADPESAHFYGDVFGYGHLTRDQYAAVFQHVAEKGWHELAECEVDEYLEVAAGFTFTQGHPYEACPDPACCNNGRVGSLRVFAALREFEGDSQSIWRPRRYEDIQVLFLVCPECSAIRATNQCT